MNLGLGLRNLRRVREILSVLVIDYGFGYVFDQLGVSAQLPMGRRRGPAREYAQMPGPRRLRLALGQLGPTFIKLGQMLSARGDLLPPLVVEELRHLQDEAPAVPFDQLRTTIEDDLGRPLEQCFPEIDPVPLAAASFGQVHRALLPDGRKVTVKVLRPGVRRVVEQDIQILSDAAYLLHRQAPALHRYDLPGLVRQFAGQLEDEMVYTFEAHNADRLRRSLADAQIEVHIPEVVWELTTRRVLTTERIGGRRVDRLPQAPPGVDRPRLARSIARAILHQVFVDGFFHGDPHQGNVLVGEDGRPILLDFGIVGYLDPRTRRLLADALRRVYDEDIDGLVTIMADLGSISPDTDLSSLRNDMARIVSRFLLVPRREFSVGDLLTRALRALWLNQVRAPAQLSLTAKTLLLTEGVCSELDPDFDFRELAEPAMADASARVLSPSAIADRALRTLESTASRLASLPARLDRVLSLLEHGGLRLRVDEPDAQARSARLARAVNRLGLSLLSLSLLISGTVFLVVGRQPTHVGLGVAALVAAVLLGVIIGLAALRPGQL
jgi:ubiquinone biosynthesis protein